MPDIHIRKSRREFHVITATSERGKQWIRDNIAKVCELAQTEEVPVASEYAEEIGFKIREDGLDVDVD